VADAWGTGTWGSSGWGGVDPNVTAALVGSFVSGRAGNIVREISQALSGAASSGAVGSVGFLQGITLSGGSAAGLAGTIAFSRTTALTGASAAQGLTGTFVPNITAFYTGTISGATGWSSGTWASGGWGGAGNMTVTSASANAGSVVSTVAPSLTGASGFAVPGSVAFEINIPLNGRTASGAAGILVPGKAAFLTGASDVLGRTGTVVVVKSVSINGNLVTGATGNLGYAYWQLIPDSQNPNWTDIVTV